MNYKNSIKGKAKLGIEAFAKSLLIIPKVLAQNSGYDIQDAIITLVDAYESKKVPVGLNLNDLGVISPELQAIYDNYCVKKQFLNISPVLAEQLLLVDEVKIFNNLLYFLFKIITFLLLFFFYLCNLINNYGN